LYLVYLSAHIIGTFIKGYKIDFFECLLFGLFMKCEQQRKEM
jgi:hypothetical protein